MKILITNLGPVVSLKHSALSYFYRMQRWFDPRWMEEFSVIIWDRCQLSIVGIHEANDWLRQSRSRKPAEAGRFDMLTHIAHKLAG